MFITLCGCCINIVINLHYILYNIIDNYLLIKVRDPTKITIEDANLAVEKCDVFDKAQLQTFVAEADVVLSTLGFSLAWSNPVPWVLCHYRMSIIIHY